MKKLVFRNYWLAVLLSLPLVISIPTFSQEAPAAGTQTQAGEPATAPKPGAETQVGALQADGAQVAWEPAESWFIYLVVFIVLFGSIVALFVIRGAVSNSQWSIADALSEEAEITATKDGAPMLDAAQNAITVVELRASASRLIALMGMIVIIMMFLGFGIFALYGFAKTGDLPDSIDKVVNFLLAGLTLFAPYVVNKFSSIFESLSPKKP